VVPLPNDTRNRNPERSESIRSMGLARDHEFNVRWLGEVRHVLKPDPPPNALHTAYTHLSLDAGRSSLVARRSYNSKVAGSSSGGHNLRFAGNMRTLTLLPTHILRIIISIADGQFAAVA